MDSSPTAQVSPLLSIDDAIKSLSTNIECLEIGPFDDASVQSELFDPVFTKDGVLKFRAISSKDLLSQPDLLYSVPVGLAALDSSETSVAFSRLHCVISLDADGRQVRGFTETGIAVILPDASVEISNTDTFCVDGILNLIELRWVSASSDASGAQFLIITGDGLLLTALTSVSPRPVRHLFRSPIDGINLSHVMYACVYLTRYIGLVLQYQGISTVCIVDLLAQTPDKRITTVYSGMPSSDGAVPQCIEFFRQLPDEVCYAVTYKSCTVRRFVLHGSELDTLNAGPLPQAELQQDSKIPRFKTPVTEQCLFARCGVDKKRVAVCTLHNSYAWVPGGGITRPHYLTLRDTGAAYDIKLGANFTLIYTKNDAVMLYDNYGHKRARGYVFYGEFVPVESKKKYTELVKIQTPLDQKHSCESCAIPVLKPAGGISATVLRGQGTMSSAGVLILDKYGILWTSL